MESLARLLVIATGGDPDGAEGLDELEGRIWLGGIAKLVQDEDVVFAVAQRIYENKRKVRDLDPVWEEAPAPVRNDYIFRALDVLDALRDLITEELAR